MISRDQIEDAFTSRVMPSKLVEVRILVTPEQRDALSFAGQKWPEIGWKHWQAHPDAFYAFTPEAFVYYLPSVLVAALEAPGKQLQVADALLRMLDRAPEADHWDAFIVQRLLGLQRSEYEVMQAWALSRCAVPGLEDADRLTRALETIDLLARETDKVRSLTKGPAND